VEGGENVLKMCREDRTSVIEQVKTGKLDAVELSTTNLVDEILLSMHDHGLLKCLENGIVDTRAHNITVPYSVVLTSAIAAKMKVQTSLTDIPYAISDHRLLAKLGYALVDKENGVGKSLMTEGSIRFLVGKYSAEDFITGYNTTVQKYIMPHMDMVPNIHILDCTDIEVNFQNTNYEKSGIGHSKRLAGGEEVYARGYKLATLRGLVNDSGIIEEIRFGSLNTHDLMLSEEMLATTKVFKPGDILVNDRGFMSRYMMNYLKTVRCVDTYIPLRKSMDVYQVAVSVATKENQWRNHPNKKFPTQRISFVTDLGEYWRSEYEDEIPDVPINGCVVWDTETDHYAVFVTTDTTKSAEMILNTYSLRPEIEEDYRQLKDFWKLEDFKSTKYNMICFHIVCVLFGYLFFQLFTMLPEGEQYAHKSLPVLLKSYSAKSQSFVILYEGSHFCILELIELLDIFVICSNTTRTYIKEILAGR